MTSFHNVFTMIVFTMVLLCTVSLNHWLTYANGVHKFRYFLYTTLYKKLPVDNFGTVVSIAILRQNAYMHEQTTIGFA